ncbi:MAG: hypothetical protein MJZ41_02545 [Bacteroidaceae bacterium]|nr:hypothetical protein [Bacteroidaceae bacterium]
MIAKINLDGKEHMAIVFDDYVVFEDVQRVKHALNLCLRYAYMREDDHLSEEEAYYYHALIEAMELSPEQVTEMFLAYFSKKGWNRSNNKAEKKLCEIYI